MKTYDIKFNALDVFWNYIYHYQVCSQSKNWKPKGISKIDKGPKQENLK